MSSTSSLILKTIQKYKSSAFSLYNALKASGVDINDKKKASKLAEFRAVIYMMEKLQCPLYLWEDISSDKKNQLKLSHTPYYGSFFKAKKEFQ